MGIADSKFQKPSPTRRLKRLYRRTRKAPIKTLHRLRGYDNSQPIILEPFNSIYFQIPKVASSSLKALFKSELELPGPAPHATRFPSLGRDELEGGIYADYFKFCFVRSPWARVVSCYQTKIMQGRNINGTFQTRLLFHAMPKSADSSFQRLASIPILNAHMSFEEFVNAVANVQDEHTDKHLRSQHTFLCNAQGELLVDYVGHLETFEDDLHYVARRIGLSVERLPHGRGKKPSYYKEYYNQDTWGIVAQRYQKDLELLGYDEYQT